MESLAMLPCTSLNEKMNSVADLQYDFLTDGTWALEALCKMENKTQTSADFKKADLAIFISGF